MSLREIRQKAVGGIGKMIEVKQKQAVSGGNGSTFRFIVVALLSYIMGYFHGSTKNISITGSGGTEKKRIHDDLMIPPFVKKPLRAQNLSITGSGGTEKKRIHDDLIIPPFVKTPLRAQHLSITGSDETEKKWIHDDLMIPPFVKPTQSTKFIDYRIERNGEEVDQRRSYDSTFCKKNHSKNTFRIDERMAIIIFIATSNCFRGMR